ncbi:MAG: glycerophosphodiester phosphodiesterase [bacterium]|nr:glycerophosphodiester phosphodiesterase [bacterium]
MTLELLKSKTGRTLVESHRGVEGEVPENSWAAIKIGHELGADLIEVDVQMSSDRVPFLRHNYQLPDGRWCSQLTWNVLKEIRIENESLPLLEDVLVWARDVGVILSLDLKSVFTPEFALSKEVIRLLERTGTKEKMLLLFLDHQELCHAKQSHPDLTVRALVTGRLAGYAEYVKKVNADCISLSYGMFRPQDVEEIHSAGSSIVLGGLWNPNTELFQELDIDILNYGNPIEARKILASK